MMKATISRKTFLEQARPVVDAGEVTIQMSGGILSVASFGNRINFRVPADVTEPGQVSISSDQWRELVGRIAGAEDSFIELEL